VLLLLAAPLLLAGWSLLGLTAPVEDVIATPADLGIYGSLSASSIQLLELADPYATLQVIAASKTLEPARLLPAGIVLVAYTLIGARAFCGWVCPVNLLLELTDWLRRRLHLPAAGTVLPRRTKIWVAAGFLVVSLLSGKLLFESISPIGAANKLLLFGSLAGTSTLVAIILAELLWSPRVWCRALCPVGGLYQLLGRLGFLRIRINHDACTRCGSCQRACLADPVILTPAITAQASRVIAGDCLRCGQCIDACPERALRFGLRGLR
jgi:ferredoxin-type protein NapH